MGCTDETSNFQYTHYIPEKGRWYCAWGYTPVYAAPKGYESELAQYLSKFGPYTRFKVTFNRQKQMWEAVPIRVHANA